MARRFGMNVVGAEVADDCKAGRKEIDRKWLYA